jgi:NADPH:quinone reductase-like Zn-dependent oxidoreductase
MKENVQMKAVVNTKYGPPDVLQLKEVEKLGPEDNEVLVEVHVSSVSKEIDDE